MEIVTLEQAKQFLDVIHNADDAKLTMLIDGAEDEALQFINRPNFADFAPWEPEHKPDDYVPPVVSSQAPASLRVGVLLLLQASYQATPDEAMKLRKAAEVKLMPYRIGLGV